MTRTDFKKALEDLGLTVPMASVITGRSSNTLYDNISGRISKAAQVPKSLETQVRMMLILKKRCPQAWDLIKKEFLK